MSKAKITITFEAVYEVNHKDYLKHVNTDEQALDWDIRAIKSEPEMFLEMFDYEDMALVNVKGELVEGEDTP
ncbi:hypothetical protein MKY98_02965 [Paenibacillus sp. FSL M8-0228]|uniref:hypothetical protein n=1 Tax=Paenibacillus sp. FSL M8-0228 TaxID=2921620 RepID=UPI0030F6A9CC